MPDHVLMQVTQFEIGEMIFQHVVSLVNVLILGHLKSGGNNVNQCSECLSDYTNISFGVVTLE